MSQACVGTHTASCTLSQLACSPTTDLNHCRSFSTRLTSAMGTLKMVHTCSARPDELTMRGRRMLSACALLHQ